jgi:antitoxin HicB
MNYPIVIYPCDEGGYVAEIPALKGCLAQGETLSETLQELEIVTTLWLETAAKRGQSLPDVDRVIEQAKALSYSGAH